MRVLRKEEEQCIKVTNTEFLLAAYRFRSESVGNESSMTMDCFKDKFDYRGASSLI